MLQRIKGDLITMAFDRQFDVIVHGCNCFNTMGSGIAKQIRGRCEPAWIVDQQSEWGDYNKLGNYTHAEIIIPATDSSPASSFTVINAYTQYNINVSGARRDVFEYNSFQLILQKLSFIYRMHVGMRFGFPYIGMGLACGDKTRIINMIEEFASIVSNNACQTSLVEFG